MGSWEMSKDKWFSVRMHTGGRKLLPLNIYWMFFEL